MFVNVGLPAGRAQGDSGGRQAARVASGHLEPIGPHRALEFGGGSLGDDPASVDDRATLKRHPWLAILSAGRPTMGPHNLATAERTLAAIADLGLDIDEMLVVVGTLEAYVRGYTLGEVAEQEAIRRSGRDTEAWMAAHAPYMQAVLAEGRHPHLARVIRDARGPHAADRVDRDFTLGLEHILDGLAVDFPPDRKNL